MAVAVDAPIVPKDASALFIKKPNGVLNGKKHPEPQSRSLETVAGLWHLAGAVYSLTVFFWHLSPTAAKLPGAKGFGWFFKFLTFWGWTLLTFQYLVCLIQLCTPRRAAIWKVFTRFTDDLSCVSFTVATTVTFQFFLLQLVTGGLVERSSDRPPWLGFVVHVTNAVLVLADVILSNPRTFSRSSYQMLFGFATTYASWMLLCRYMNGKFPYPFMNKLDPALAYLSMLILSLVVMYLISLSGVALSRASTHLLSKPAVLTPATTSDHPKATNGKKGGKVA